jgi:hypothetical protein
MRIAKKTGSLIVLEHDSLSLIQELLVGIVIIYFGSYVIYIALTDHTNKPAGIVLLLLGAFICFGLYYIFSSLLEGVIVIEMDKDAGKMIYSRTGLLAKDYVECDLNDISVFFCPTDGESSSYGVLNIRDEIFELHTDLFAVGESPKRIVDEVSDFLNISQRNVKYI